MVDSPIKYHGGKSYLASKIVAMMPPHTHYVEPYFGGGSVLFAKNPFGISEVANDINGELTNFWMVLQNGFLFDLFRRKVDAIPFSENEWMDACNCEDSDPVHRAIAFFIRCRQSLAGRMKDFATVSRNRTRRGMNEQVSAWLSAIDGLPEVHARLKRVLILNRPALDVVRQQDGPSTLYYLDPPYVHETRASKDVYEHEMTTAQHKELLCVLVGIKGKFMLSGYRSQLYDEVAANRGWRRVDFDLPNNSAGGDTKRRMTECVWMNFS